ncbi:conserved hypothetical protein [Vibrio crassostreae]|nr:hypothetical protein [Vibrio crassostreae]NOI53587.1 hypothetical protein [Vibrio crassostreae]CAK1885342.1 conserved hypothetical protein [Vibrio crassostreae]CAK1885459.1 conserved hypothetical protein [Vibrio crassostreae]CAK1885476.1 conserved hypothetical protein [Vibrio crassostreae]
MARYLQCINRPFLSRGSPSQLTLLVNLILVHKIYKPIAVIAIGYFFACRLANRPSLDTDTHSIA